MYIDFFTPISLPQTADATTIEVVGRATQRTNTNDTDDITFTVRFTGEAGENRAITMEYGAITRRNPIAVVAVGISPGENFFLRGTATHDVTLTIERSEIAKHRPGKRNEIDILLTGGDISDPDFFFQIPLTLNVRKPNDPLIDFELTVEGNIIQNIPEATAISDATFTLQVTNIGTDPDTISLEISADSGPYSELSGQEAVDLETMTAELAQLALSSTSVTLASQASEAVTLTIPGILFAKYSFYPVTVKAISGLDKNLTSTLTVRVNIISNRVGLTLEGLDGLTRTSTTSDTDDITYTLRITNTGSNLDRIDFEPVSDSTDTAILDQTELTLFPDSYEDITLTIPRTALSTAGTYTISVIAESQNDSRINAFVITETIITGEASSETDETDEDSEEDENGEAGGASGAGGTDETDQTPTEQATYRVIFSEFMFEAGGDEAGLPQWLEVYNNGSTEVNLSGWKLHWKSPQPAPLELTFTFEEDFRIPPEQARLIVTAFGRHSGGGNLSDDDVYQLPLLHIAGLEQEIIVSQFQSITGGGFSLKLTNSQDTLVDQIATFTGDEKTWDLPDTLVEGVRSSLIRRFDEKVPRAGIARRGWIRAVDTKNLVAGIYYGSPQDLGTPGYRRGKPLPVELSHFSAKFVKDEVLISWTTESELNNAGFNIFRSTSRAKSFQRINPKLIQGAGTTGERSTYQFIDRTAKPDVAYYYRLEDVDLTGTRGIQTTVRLRGVIAPTGKHLITWGTLKNLR